MTTIFTRKDIQTEIFEVDGYLGTAKAKSLETYLLELEDSDCYVVDITLLETKQSGLGNYSKYLIRYVAPKYEVKVDRKTWDDFAGEWWSFGAKTERVFDTMVEAETYKKEVESEGVIVDIIEHSPLDLPL